MPHGRYADSPAHQHVALQPPRGPQVPPLRWNLPPRPEARQLPREPGLLREDLRLRPLTRHRRCRAASLAGTAKHAPQGRRAGRELCAGRACGPPHAAHEAAPHRACRDQVVPRTRAYPVAGELYRGHRYLVRRLHLRRAPGHAGRHQDRGPGTSLPRLLVLPTLPGPQAQDRLQVPHAWQTRPAQHDLQSLGHAFAGRY
mmetsp:Transcript_94340/g.304646  ORF Transcript_94340/g.304646 Transcript_94340/m.304646 type:complete len:200 (-) Transcript_94340:548-1147(-)